MPLSIIRWFYKNSKLWLNEHSLVQMNSHYQQTYQLLHSGSWNARLRGCIHQLQSYLRGKKTNKQTLGRREKVRKKKDFHPVASWLVASSGIPWWASFSPVQDVVRMRRRMKMNLYSFLPNTITVFIETNTMPQLVVSAYDTVSADFSIIKHY